MESLTRIERPLSAEWKSLAGAGEEVLYVPGIDGSGELLLGARRDWEARYRLGCLHYEYHGGKPGDDAYASLADSIVERLDDAGLRRPLVVAESFGVAVALRLTLDHPDRVRALMLVNGFARYPKPLRARAGKAVARAIPSAMFRFVRRYGARYALFAPRVDEAAEREFHAIDRLELDGGYRYRLAMVARCDLLDELEGIRHPVEFYASDKDRVVDSMPAGREIVRRVDGARLIPLEQAGHVVLPLADEPWTSRIDALLARSLPGGPASTS